MNPVKDAKYTAKVVGGEASVPIPGAFDQKQMYNAIDIHIPNTMKIQKNMRLYVDEGAVIDRTDPVVDIEVNEYRGGAVGEFLMKLLGRNGGLIDNVSSIQTSEGRIPVRNYDLV